MGRHRRSPIGTGREPATVRTAPGRRVRSLPGMKIPVPAGGNEQLLSEVEPCPGDARRIIRLLLLVEFGLLRQGFRCPGESHDPFGSGVADASLDRGGVRRVDVVNRDDRELWCRVTSRSGRPPPAMLAAAYFWVISAEEFGVALAEHPSRHTRRHPQLQPDPTRAGVGQRLPASTPRNCAGRLQWRVIATLGDQIAEPQQGANAQMHAEESGSPGASDEESASSDNGTTG